MLRNLCKFLRGYRNVTSYLLDKRGLQTEGYVITSKKGLRLKLRAKTCEVGDVDVFDEVLLDDQYGMRDLTKPDAVVLDIGAHIGLFSCAFAHQFPQSTVYAFEPQPSNFAALKGNVALNNLGNVSIDNLAVSGKTGTLELVCSDSNTGAHSVFAPNGESCQVNCISLADLFAQKTIGQVDILKIDCEGSEYPILLESDEALLRRAKKSGLNNT